MHRWKLPLVLFSLALVLGCGRQTPVSPAPDASSLVPKVDLSELDRIERATRLPNKPLALGGPKLVVLPAGSADALAAAIAHVGDAGTVVLESGVHTESGPVEVTHSVTIYGEDGAVLESATDPEADELQAALWIHGAGNVVVRGVEFRPAGEIGNTAILLQDAPNASVMANNMHDYRFGVIIEKSDRAKVWSNRIACRRDIPPAHGIVVVNGTESLLANNRISGAGFGIWACDRGGRAIGNRITGSGNGLILCKVPAGGFLLPDGSPIGANESAANWLVQRNETYENRRVGILTIDGANNSMIADNNSHDNGTYDVEMTGESFRFGFLTPASFNCKFVAGSYPNVRVKDCGNGNNVVGGVLVDNNADPCN